MVSALAACDRELEYGKHGLPHEAAARSSEALACLDSWRDERMEHPRVAWLVARLCALFYSLAGNGAPRSSYTPARRACASPRPYHRPLLRDHAVEATRRSPCVAAKWMSEKRLRDHAIKLVHAP